MLAAGGDCVTAACCWRARSGASVSCAGAGVLGSAMRLPASVSAAPPAADAAEAVTGGVLLATEVQPEVKGGVPLVADVEAQESGGAAAAAAFTAEGAATWSSASATIEDGTVAVDEQSGVSDAPNADGEWGACGGPEITSTGTSIVLFGACRSSAAAMPGRGGGAATKEPLPPPGVDGAAGGDTAALADLEVTGA